MTDSGSKCTLGKFVGVTQVSAAAGPLEGQNAIEQDLDKLEKWVQVKLMQLYKAKCWHCT